MNQENVKQFDAEDKTIFGFWVYLMTDLVLFASLFATYMVLRERTLGEPGAGELLSLPLVLVMTLILLTSSFTCGLAVLAMHRRKLTQMFILFGITALLGVSFLGLELHEFAELVHEGYSWQRNAFLSAFFTLVGTHGLHIAAGLIWIITLMVRVASQGLTPRNIKRLAMFSMFWHFLDVVWIFIFTIVYLIGAA